MPLTFFSSLIFCVILGDYVKCRGTYFFVGEQLDQEHDVKYFRNLLISETDRFNVMCEKWETINTPELTEEGKYFTCRSTEIGEIDQVLWFNIR